MSCTAVTMHSGSIVECNGNHTFPGLHVGIACGDVIAWPMANDAPMNGVRDFDRSDVGKKHDASKLDWAQLAPFLPALEEVARVLQFGAQKHNEKPGTEAWRTVEDAAREYGTAAARHALKRVRGIKFDEQTKRPHLAHAIANLLIVMMTEGEYLP